MDLDAGGRLKVLRTSGTRLNGLTHHLSGTWNSALKNPSN
jgi:hypothetical protein